jgi:hypothetical protein
VGKGDKGQVDWSGVCYYFRYLYLIDSLVYARVCFAHQGMPFFLFQPLLFVSANIGILCYRGTVGVAL